MSERQIRPASGTSLMERLTRRQSSPVVQSPAELEFSNDDYVMSAPVSPLSERTPLLSPRADYAMSAPVTPRVDRIPRPENNTSRSYRSLVSKSDPGSNKLFLPRRPRIPRSLTRAASTLFHRREGTYDDTTSKRALMSQSTGVRLWYGNYTSIDWIHDVIKDSIRVRRLRATKGSRGWFLNSWDRSQAWILLFFIGIVMAIIAAGIDISQEWLSDFKEGYCSGHWTSNRAFCCWGVPEGQVCENWREWGPLLEGRWKGDPRGRWDPNYLGGWIAYGFIGGLYVLIAAVLVQRSKTIIYPSGVTVGENTPPIVATFAAGGGIPEIRTILSGFVIRGFLGFKTLVVKIIGLSLATSSGLNCGKEGPFVHIACCIGNIACRFFKKYNKNDGKRREIYSASAAAGVACAFAAPVGGVLFSLEGVSYYFPPKTMIRSYFCATVAVITLKLLNPYGTGKIVMFQVTYDKEWHWFEFPAFILLGIFGGLYGAAFCYLNIRWQRFRNTSFIGRHPVMEALLVLTITVIVSYSNVYSRMALTEFVTNLFAECSKLDSNEGLCASSLADIPLVQQLLSSSLLTKICLVIITFGLRIPAGIFLPSLAVGAILGRILGLQMQYLTWVYPNSSIFAPCGSTAANGQCIIPGVYAMVGAAASLASVTKTTLSLVVIVFELTGTLVYMLPIMSAVLISKWISDATGVHSIYDLINEMNGRPYLNSQREYIHDCLAVDITEPMEPIEVHRTNNVNSLTAKLERLEKAGYKDAGFAILEGEILQGYIAANELEHGIQCVKEAGNEDIECTFLRERTHLEDETDEEILGEVQMGDFSQFVDHAPLTINHRASMELVMEIFIKLGVRYLCVTNAAGCYLGVIHKKRLLAYLREFDEKNEG